MGCFLRCVIFGALTAVLPVLAQLQLPSCYTTTTVVFGNPASILSSLSIVSNLTNTASSTATSTFSSYLPSIQLLTSSTTSPASPVVTGLFRITISASGIGKLRTRGIDYLSFENTIGIVTTDPMVATIFQFINGYLQTSTGLYVEAGSSSGYTQVELSSFAPPAAQEFTVNSDGSITLIGASEICCAANDTLYIVFNQQPPFFCTIARLEVSGVSATTSSIVTSQSIAIISIVETMTFPSSTPAMPTSNQVISISTPAASSQQTVLTSPQSSSNQMSSQPPLVTSTRVPLPPSSLSSQAGASTTSIAPLSSSSQFTSSIISSTSSLQPGSSTSSSSTLAVVSNLINIIGLGQLSSSVSSIFSLPFVVSSISSSTSTTSSMLLLSSITSVSSSRSSSSSGSSSLPLSTSVASSSGRTTSIASSAPSSASSPSRSSTPSSILTSSIASSSSSKTSSISSTSSFAALPSPYQRNSGKRGLAYTNVTLTQLYSLQGQNSQVSWAYDYYSLPNATNNVGPVNPALTFIPLLYNNAPSLTSIWAANAQYSIQTYGSDALFSFNEPDACNNGQSACMSVSASVSAYQTYMQPFAGQVLLGAPGVTNGGPPASLTYLSYFLGNCTGCTVDFINLHWYSSPYSFSYLTSYIQQAYAVGGNRPIYLTEFGMDNIYYAEADVATFLKNATTWLDAQPYVHRYSWFGDFAQTGPAYEQGYGYLVNGSGNALSNEGVVWNNYTGGYVACPISSGC